MLLLAIVASAIGATALAYNVLDNGRLTAIGVLVTFVLLVQFGSFLADLEERSRRGIEGPEPSLWRALIFEPRRLLEVFADFVLICASFFVAYAARGRRHGDGLRALRLPVGLADPARRALRVLRRARRVPARVALRDRARRRRDRGRLLRLGLVAYLILVALRPIGSVPAPRRSSSSTRSSAPCSSVRLGSRCGSSRDARCAQRAHGASSWSAPGARVGASPVSCARATTRRSSGSSTTTHACGGGASPESACVGGLDEAERAIATTRADEVLVTIPAAAAERLVAVTRGCGARRDSLPDRAARSSS